MLWTCSGKRICLREYHGIIERIMLPISTSVGETTDDVMQITKFADGLSYFTPSKISETFLTPTTSEDNPPHQHAPQIRRPPILSTDFTRASTFLTLLLLSPTPQSLVYHQQCDHYFTPHIHFNSGLGYLIESFFRGCLLSFFRGPPSPPEGNPPRLRIPRDRSFVFVFPSYLVLLLSLFGGRGAGMDLHEPFLYFITAIF
jgi:hypothetical protein